MREWGTTCSGEGLSVMLNDLYQALDPVALSLGPLVIRWYGIAYLTGFLLAAFIIYRVARHWKLTVDLRDSRHPLRRTSGLLPVLWSGHLP